jgi:hypothetical protein
MEIKKPYLFPGFWPVRHEEAMVEGRSYAQKLENSGSTKDGGWLPCRE